MPKARTFTTTAPASSSSHPPAPAANSNVFARPGERLPLRPAQDLVASAPAGTKRRQTSGSSGFESPVLPRSSSSLFGDSAAERSSAPTVPPPSGGSFAPSSPFDRQPPLFRFPSAAPSPFLSPSGVVLDRAAVPGRVASPVAPEASTLLLSPVDPVLPGGTPPAVPFPGPWPPYSLSIVSHPVTDGLPPSSSLSTALPVANPSAVPDAALFFSVQESLPSAVAEANAPALNSSLPELPLLAQPGTIPHSPSMQQTAPPSISDAAITSQPSLSDAAIQSLPRLDPQALQQPSQPLAPADPAITSATIPSHPPPGSLAQQQHSQLHAQSDSSISSVQVPLQLQSGPPARHHLSQQPEPASPAVASAQVLAQTEGDSMTLTPSSLLTAGSQPSVLPPQPSALPPQFCPPVRWAPPPHLQHRVQDVMSGLPPPRQHLAPPRQLPRQHSSQLGQRLVLTESARDLLLNLHGGEIDPYQPLDENGVSDLVDSIQVSAHARFGLALTHRMALTSLEVSRYLPQACGWPSVEGALHCLRPALPQPVAPSPSSLAEKSAPPPIVHQAVAVQPAPPAASLTGNSAQSSFIRRAAPLVPHPPPPLLTINSSLANSARFRNVFRSRAAPLSASATSRQEPTSGNIIPPCVSCGESGHDAFNCPQGLDVNHIVDSAQEFGRACNLRLLQLSSSRNISPGNSNADAATSECSRAVRGEAVEFISDISGIDANDVSGRLDDDQGDAESTFISAICYSRGGKDAAVYEDVCSRELQRRRRQPQLLEASHVAAQAPDSASAYRLLNSRINLAAHLGRSYRIDGGDGIQLPPFPSRPVNVKRRRAKKDDLPGFVVDDHDSEPDGSSSPRGRRHGRKDSNEDPSDLSGSGSDDDADNSGSSSRSQNSDSSIDEGDNPSSDRDEASENSSSDSDKSEAVVRPRKERKRSRSPDRNLLPDNPLTAESLGQILKKLLDKRGRSDNNGLLASKTPSFWDLGKSPSGGYFAQTFTKVYGEFRQFKSVFGSKTGVSFKNLIMENMIPMIRDDLRLSRKDWKSITDRDLISKLKRRLGFRERDAYIAELEACPRLSASASRDMTVLNAKFKEMAAQMLSICERARNHGVKLLKPSCKHVFSEAVKNCYRVNQWFRLRPFKSIGDSVRHINSKLARRLASAAEQKHENAMDEAKLNGVRHQIGGGTTEDSSAPARKKGSVKGGINKNRKDGHDDKASRDAHSKKMDELYKAENELPKGRYWHLKTSFCEGDPCNCKFCQGCGDHQKKGRPWHDRPRCRQRGHPDFVSTGYFHDRHPNRSSIHDKSSSVRFQSDKGSPSREATRDKTAARSNGVQKPDENSP